MESGDNHLSPADRQLLGQLAMRMRLFAYLLIASIVASVLAQGYRALLMGINVPNLVGFMSGTTLTTIISFVIALFTLSASAAIQMAAQSDGNDVRPLMQALSALKRLYGIQYWLIVITILLVIFVMIGAFVLLFTMR
jgi:hypothetical protein